MKLGGSFSLFFSLLLLNYVLAACVNECNSHGNCVGGSCVCQTGWGGSDCSIWDHIIYSGVEQTGHLNTFQWKYFHFTTADELATFTVYVNQTSAIGDMDLYIGKDYYPDTTHFDYSDTTTNEHLSFTTQIDSQSTWYFGLYGYWSVDFSIILYSSLRGCTRDCGINGYCNVSTCICYEPFTGVDCSIYDLEVSSGVSHSNTVNTGEWYFYHFTGIPGQSADIILTQTNTSYDLDLYVRKVERPTTWRFDFYNGTTQAVSQVHIANLTGVVYEIGVYGYYGGPFDIIYTQYLDDGTVCLNQCSDHGTCDSHHCYCDESYSGSTCETYDDNLEFDTYYAGKVEASFWNYWHIHYFSSSSIRIDLNQESEDGDCDLYVRSNTLPTITIYQMANTTDLQHTSVTIQSPGDSTWYIGVFGWSSCTYSLIVTEIVECQCEADSHGRCLHSSVECICEPGYTGTTCTTATTLISNQQVITGLSIEPNNWTFYHFSSSSTAVVITLVETASHGKLMLIVSMNRYPSGQNFDYYDISTSDFHEVHVFWENPVIREYFIGVTTTTVTVNSEPITYSITAYGTPF